MPDGARVMITPQKSYLPLGSLKGALLYPEPDLVIGDDRLAAALERVGLGALVPRLDEVARWDQVLSNGERQRLAIARLLDPQAAGRHPGRCAVRARGAGAADAARAAQDRPARRHHHQSRPAAGAAGSTTASSCWSATHDGAVLVPAGTPALANAT